MFQRKFNDFVAIPIFFVDHNIFYLEFSYLELINLELINLESINLICDL